MSGSKKLNRSYIAILACVSILTGAVMIVHIQKHNTKAVVASDTMNLTPWESVGGCGAGGSGGGGGGIKWVGMGVSGGLIDVEVMLSTSMGQNFNQKTLKTRLSMKPTWTSNLGLTVPIVSKIGSLQPQSNFDDKTEVTGGYGDISIDYSRSFGMSGQFSLALALTLPTGQYDIKRGKENEELYLPSSLQKGGGLLSPSLTLSYSRDVEDGIWLYDVGYSHPMAINLKGENEFFEYTDAQLDKMSDEDRKRFDFIFKPYGENKLGAYTPPSVNGSVYFGYRGVEHYVHSFGVTFSAPLGVAWIPNFTYTNSISGYDPFPDPDHKAWTASLNYGLEFSKPKYPIFIGVSLPIQDKANDPDPDDKYNEEPLKKWDAPDLKDLANSWTVGIGVKSTMF